MRQVVFGKSVRGASHIRSGTDCQDSFKQIVLEDNTVILAVADGHGSSSCPYSKTGARLAVNVFCDIMKSLYFNYLEALDQLPSYLNREGELVIARTIDHEWKRRVVERHKRNNRVFNKLKDGSIDYPSVFKQYGSTLLGLMITNAFVYAFQLGDGDICYVNDNRLEKVIESEKILGVETHSLSRDKAWQNALSLVQVFNIEEHLPALFSLSTDGYSNSYKNENEFQSAITDYLHILKEHGAKAVENSLPIWLAEISKEGCGDDITMLIAYYSPEEAIME